MAFGPLKIQTEPLESKLIASPTRYRLLTGLYSVQLFARGFIIQTEAVFVCLFLMMSAIEKFKNISTKQVLVKKLKIKKEKKSHRRLK